MLCHESVLKEAGNKVEILDPSSEPKKNTKKVQKNHQYDTSLSLNHK